jgi:hypothetical protein
MWDSETVAQLWLWPLTTYAGRKSTSLNGQSSRGVECARRPAGVRFFAELCGGLGVTFDEARGCSELALWSGGREESLLTPDSGVVIWRSVGELGVVHGNSWHPVPSGTVVPLDGWSHRFDCTCSHCR